MASTTKQAKKQAKAAGEQAKGVLKDQQAVLDRANSAARDLGANAQRYARETLVPGAKTVYEERVQPAARRGAVAGKVAGAYVGSTAKDAAQGVLVPAATSFATAALALLNEGGERLGIAGERNEAARKRLTAATKAGEKAQRRARVKVKGAAKVGKAAAKHGAKRAAKATGRSGGIGAGGIIGIVLGALVVGGIAYAVWQTLRADDDLWVADEDPETTPNAPDDAPTA